MTTPDHITPQDNKDHESGANDSEKKKRLKTAKNLAQLALLGSAFILPQALGYVSSYRDVSGVRQYEITDRGEDAIVYVTDKIDSAADAVTGLFSTAPDENGEAVEFYIDEGTPEPAEAEQGE